MSIPLSNVDAAWYQMEDPTNLMMVTSIVLLNEQVDVERFRQTIEERILKQFERFRSRVVESTLPMMTPRWEIDRSFDLKSHVHHVALPEPGDQTVLQNFVSDLMSTPLDFSKPPWQIHVLDNYGRGSAVLFRIHHCIADGIALVRVLLSVTDTQPNAPIKLGEPKPRRPRRSPSMVEALLKPAADALKLGQRMAEALIHESMEAWINPQQAIERGLAAAALAAKGATATGKLLLMPPDPSTPFKGKLGIQKRAAWTDQPLSLDDVKRVGKVTGGKVNDVLLTAMTGALRRYLIGRGTDVTGMNFRAAVPVNLRPLDKDIELGNVFGLVFLALPVGIEDPLDRLVELKRRMDEIKDSPEALVALGILGILGATPGQLSDQFINIMGAKATAVATNVPGPPVTIYMAGCAIDNIMFWVPQSGRLGLGISIFSYAGKVTLGVATDVGLVPDPEAILQGFYDEFDALLALVEMVEEETAEPVTADASIPDPRFCQGMTKSGRQCRNKPLTGSNFCHRHQPEEEVLL